MDNKTITMNGGLEVAVIFEDGRQETLKVRQFKLREYPAVYPLVFDDFSLAARACDKPKQVIESLTPESFEAVYAALKEVNANGFFCYTDRQTAMNLKTLPPGLIDKIIARTQNTFSTPSPILPPPQG